MKIVIGVDGSVPSRAAVAFASHLLDPQRDTPVLYYAVPTAPPEYVPSDSPETLRRAGETLAEAVFQQAQEALPEGLQERCITVHDRKKPRQGLLDAAQEHQAEMLVVGARGTNRLQRLLLGSVSRSVAHACQLPTLIVRATGESTAEGTDAPEADLSLGIHTLLACAEQAGGEEIASFMGRLQWPDGSSARIIHVAESFFPGELPDWLTHPSRSEEVEQLAVAWKQQYEQDRQRVQQQMEAVARGLPAAFGERGVAIEEGNPAEQILQAIDRERTDLVVLGTRGLGAMMRFLLGSTSEHVLSHAPCSVLLVPQKGRE